MAFVEGKQLLALGSHENWSGGGIEDQKVQMSSKLLEGLADFDQAFGKKEILRVFETIPLQKYKMKL
jgi:hypothetical protein